MTETTHIHIEQPRDEAIADLEMRLQHAFDRLAHIESQILYRDESMPVWADQWHKFRIGDKWHCVFEGWTDSCNDVESAPDYRPDEDECTLAIIDPPRV